MDIGLGLAEGDIFRIRLLRAWQFLAEYLVGGENDVHDPTATPRA